MLNLVPSSVPIYVYVPATDMRKGFEGLSAVVRQAMTKDPLSGALFVFRNRRGNRLKILYWDQDGYALWYKHLQRGTFQWPRGGPTASMEVEYLQLVLSGIDVNHIRRRQRFQLKTG